MKMISKLKKAASEAVSLGPVGFVKYLMVKYRELIMYGIMGVMTTVVYFGVYALFKHLGMHYMANSCVSWAAAVMFAFITNKYFVFRSMENTHFAAEMIKFFGARAATLLMDLGITWLMIDVIGIGEWPTKMTSQVVVMVLNYVFSKLFVFRSSGSSSSVSSIRVGAPRGMRQAAFGKETEK